MEFASIADGPGSSRTFVNFDGHFGFAKSRVVSTRHNSVEVAWVRCCENGPTKGQFMEVLGERFQWTFGSGLWVWKKKSPYLVTTLPVAGPCREKKENAIEALFPPVEVLHARFEEISVIDDKADGGSATSARIAKLRALLYASENDAEFAKTVKVRLAEEEIVHRFYKGIALLEKKAASYLPTICELIQHRKHQAEDLQSIFDRAAAADSRDGREDVWLSRQLAANTRAVRRKEDRHYSETGDSKKESRLREEEIMPLGLNKVANRLFGKKGPDALAVYAVFKASRCYFRETRRVIPQTDVNDDPASDEEADKEDNPGFWARISRRLEVFDFSTIADNVLIVCPLALVCWALRKEFSNVCTLLGLHNLARLNIGLSEALDALEADWVRKTEAPEWAAKTKEEKDKERASLESEAARAIAISKRALRELQMEDRGEPECEHRLSTLSPAENTNLEPTDESGEECGQGLPSVREPPDQSTGLPLYPLQDATLGQQAIMGPRSSEPNVSANSAYDTDASTTDNVVPHAFPVTHTPDLAWYTANPTAPGSLRGDGIEVASGTPPVQETAQRQTCLRPASELPVAVVNGPVHGRAMDAGTDLPLSKRQRPFPPLPSREGDSSATTLAPLPPGGADTDNVTCEYARNIDETLLREDASPLELPSPCSGSEDVPTAIASATNATEIGAQRTGPTSGIRNSGHSDRALRNDFDANDTAEESPTENVASTALHNLAHFAMANPHPRALSSNTYLYLEADSGYGTEAPSSIGHALSVALPQVSQTNRHDTGAHLPPRKRQRTNPVQTRPNNSNDWINDEVEAYRHTRNTDETPPLELPHPYPNANSVPHPVASGSNYDPIRNSYATTTTNLSGNDGESPLMPSSGDFSGNEFEPLQQGGAEPALVGPSACDRTDVAAHETTDTGNSYLELLAYTSYEDKDWDEWFSFPTPF